MTWIDEKTFKFDNKYVWTDDFFRFYITDVETLEECINPVNAFLINFLHKEDPDNHIMLEPEDLKIENLYYFVPDLFHPGQIVNAQENPEAIKTLVVEYKLYDA